jgi:hypothetical protein
VQPEPELFFDPQGLLAMTEGDPVDDTLIV